MTRTFLAIAAALFAATTFFTPAAEACISCEYVPPVVNTPVYSHGSGHYERRSYSAHKPRRVHRAKRRVVDTERKVKHTAKAKAKVETTKTTKTAKVAPETPAKKTPVTENSSITTASTETTGSVDIEPARVDEPTVSKGSDCKKFFASVGMTLTVPCQ